MFLSRYRYFQVASMALSGTFALNVSSLAEDWPQWMGPQRDGISLETAWDQNWQDEEPKVLWDAEVGLGCAGISVSDGRLFTTGNTKDNHDRISCLDAETGKEIWRYRYFCPTESRMFDGGTAATPTVHDGLVYSLSHNGRLFCLRAEDASELWRKDLVKDLGGEQPRWGYSGSPLVVGDHVYVEPGKGGGTIAALDRMTGELVWKAGNDETAYASLLHFSHGGKEGIVSFNAHGLVGFDIDAQKEWFRTRWETPTDVNATTPLYSQGLFLVSSAYRKGAGLFHLHEGNLVEKYTTKSLLTQFQNMVLFEGNVYAVNGDNSTRAELVCLDFLTGKVLWNQRLSGNRGHVLIADGKLLVLSDRGEMILADASPSGFRERGRFQALRGRAWTAPVLANGKLFCRNSFGNLVCYDLSQ